MGNVCLHGNEAEMKGFVKIAGYTLWSILVGLFLLAKCSEPTMDEKEKMCVEDCSKRDRFGVLVAPFPNSTKSTAANYTCKCY